MTLSKVLRIVIISFLIILLFFFLFVKIHEYDVWFHLSAGKYIWHNFRVPFLDPFSYTAENYYIDSHWLFQVILYLFYKLSGIFGIFLYQLIIVGLTFFILFQTGKKSDFYITSFSVLLTILLASRRFLYRPEMFSSLYTVLFILILDKYTRERNKKLLFILPFLQILWTNMHGYFIFGPIIVGCYLIGEFIQNKKIEGNIILFLVLCIAACFVNPYGYKLVEYPFILFSEVGNKASAYSKSVVELAPLFLAEKEGYNKYAYILLILISLAGFILTKKIRISRLLVYIVFLYLSWLAVRNTANFAFVACIITIFNAENMRDIRIDPNIRLFKIFKYGYLIFILLFVIITSYNIALDKYYVYGGVIKNFGVGKVDIMFPIGADEFIKNNNLKGNIFNDALIGGYFTWDCYPERKVFMDGRMEVFGEKFLEKYKSVYDNPEVFFDKVKDEYSVEYVLLHPLSPHSENLIKYLNKDKLWKLAYLDESGVVFIKNNNEVKSSIKEPEVSSFDVLEKIPAYLSYANFYYFTEQYEKAKTLYLAIIKLNPDFVESYVNLGSIFLIEKKYRESRECFESALKKSNRYAEPYFGISTIY